MNTPPAAWMETKPVETIDGSDVVPQEPNFCPGKYTISREIFRESHRV